MKAKMRMIPQGLRSATCWLMAFAMLTINPVPVQAQPLVGESLNITPIGSGSSPLHPTAQELVINNETDYSNFFNGSPPATPTVNFALQDVLAVTLGTQPAGSSVSIPRVTIDTTGFTAGFGDVYVNSIIGTGGTTVTGPVTISNGTLTNTGGSAQSTGADVVISGGTITIMNPPTGPIVVTSSNSTTTIAGGTLTIMGGTTTAVSGGTTYTNTGGTTATTGATMTTSNPVTATGGTFSISGGTLSTLPGGGLVLTGGTLTITGATTTFAPATNQGISSTGGTAIISGGTTVENSGATTNPFAVVAVPKGALFYDFLNTVTPVPFTGSVLPFSSLSHVIGNMTTPYIESITIDGSGHVTINKSRASTGGTTISGTLTQADFQALGIAFLTTNFATLPPTITDPLSPKTPILPNETFTSVVNGASHATAVQSAGFYGGSSSLKLLEDAIRGPVERIKRQTVGSEIQGTVTLNATALMVGSLFISPDDPFYDLLVKLNGKKVGLEVITGPTGPVSVLSVNTHAIAPGKFLAFPNIGGDVLLRLPMRTPVRITDFSLFGTYVEAKLGQSGKSGFVQTSSVVAEPSAAGQAKIEDLLFQKYLQQGGLIWNGAGPGPVTTGWVDPNTGQSAPAPTENEWQHDTSDPDHATNINTGQNAFYDHENQEWIDAATGQALSQSGNSPATVDGVAFQVFLQEGGLIWNGAGPGPVTTGWVDPNTGQSAPAPTENEWQRDTGDPDHAVNINTGQNAFYDHESQQWIDAATGQPLSPSLR